MNNKNIQLFSVGHKTALKLDRHHQTWFTIHLNAKNRQGKHCLLEYAIILFLSWQCSRVHKHSLWDSKMCFWDTAQGWLINKHYTKRIAVLLRRTLRHQLKNEWTAVAHRVPAVPILALPNRQHVPRTTLPIHGLYSKTTHVLKCAGDHIPPSPRISSVPLCKRF